MVFVALRAVMAEARSIKSLAEAISNLIDEGAFKANKDGIKMRAVDPAHVAMVILNLTPKAFEEYEIDKETVLGIDFEKFNTILRRAGPNEKLEMKIDEGANRLKITIKGISTRSFNLPLIEVSEEELKIPQIDYPAIIKIDASVVREGLKDAETVSDHVAFEADKNAFYMRASGDAGEVEVKVGKDDEAMVELSAKEPVKSLFSIEYLDDMMKASFATDVVLISLGNNLPAQLELNLGGDAGKIMFLLAPRIEST